MSPTQVQDRGGGLAAQEFVQRVEAGGQRGAVGVGQRVQRLDQYRDPAPRVPGVPARRRTTRPAASSPDTVEVMVAGLTRSARASSVIASGPPYTITDSADSRAGDSPEPTSTVATRRSRCTAAECSRHKTSWPTSCFDGLNI
jgi:hypothetical protein